MVGRHPAPAEENRRRLVVAGQGVGVAGATEHVHGDPGVEVRLPEPLEVDRRRLGAPSRSRDPKRRASGRCPFSSWGWAKTSTTCGRSSRGSSPRRWLVSFSAVAKRYPGGEEALRNVTFTVEPGELLFITGRSGAGKSTLLKLIPAIERPSSGSVLAISRLC